MDNSQVKYESYQKHFVFEEIKQMMDFYDSLSDTCFSFIPLGTIAVSNYATYVFLSIKSTLDSIKTLLQEGHISDAFVLIRKLFDTVLVEIYLNVVREEKYDWMESVVVKDVDDWIKNKIRIPRVDKILSVLRNSSLTKDLYPFFGWDSYLKKNRGLLDDHVHCSSYTNILLNCQNIFIENRERQLKNAFIVLNQIFLVHLAFIFYMNGHYMMATDYVDYLDVGMTPPEGSERWIAPYAQEAFDKYIKPHAKLAEFIKKNCGLDIV